MSEQATDQVRVTESSAEVAGGVVGLTPLAQRYLDETRPWVRFISIMTFVAAGFMLLGGFGLLAASVFGGLAAKTQGGVGAFGCGYLAGLTMVYVMLACVYVAGGLYLARYAKAIAHLRANATAVALEDALKHQKSFWRFAGIVIAIGLAVTVVLMVVTIVAGAIAGVMAYRS